ncbi:Uncharacterized protein YrkH [Geodia barretti]|uniref:Uncharacterized protein YrkH n=1 Tax=Geodia barretti TaxID=519541 RepID=A0AA35SAF9_GEOBA|nr:Uncharacterized protein YrkH [Geodia barretti]
MDLEVLPSGLKTVVSEKGGLEVRIYYLECLAQATYIISHEGAAFIVDPRRDVDVYIKDLAEHKLKLKGILETHFHADFVSGHCELARRTGATIYFGPGAASRTQFTIHEMKDGEVIELSSRYAIRAIHTPGHTPESVVYLIQEGDKPLKAFTGDTLMIGSCGRPDLVGSIGHTADQMARLMYNSLWKKLAVLPDSVQIFPAHGAGSPCGKNLGSALYCTIGTQKLTNPAFHYQNVRDYSMYASLMSSIHTCWHGFGLMHIKACVYVNGSQFRSTQINTLIWVWWSESRCNTVPIEPPYSTHQGAD